MIIRPDRQPLPRLLRFLGGVVLAFLLALGAYAVLLQPSAAAIQTMALYLATTALLSIVASYGVVRLGLLTRVPRLQGSWLIAAGLAGILTFFNVWAPARWLGLAGDDLRLLAILLVFAAIIAASVMLYLVAPLTATLRALVHGSRELARGRLATRINLPGRDEAADAARAFNQLAVQLDQATRQQREVDDMRRELIAWVGHDLRTPLASVRATVQALVNGVVEDRMTAQRYLQAAQRDLNAVVELVDDLYEMTQINTGGLKVERAPASLAGLVTTVIQDYEDLAAHRSIRLEPVLLPGVDPVVMDAERIARVLANLVANALQHTPDGGKVVVRAYPVPDGVAVDVVDNGEGIAEEELARVFDQFFRGESARRRNAGGAGLGLAIARGIVEAHGGRITVQSTPGHGSTFNFRIPQTTQVEVRNPLRRWRGRSVDGAQVI